ncbi:hypothetical protein VHEMI09420 [[Torrubiella] hemipterigena]|uniref:Uncharacterized protein n=1 Tax=[Torrubiella] hemipterigena TaxID=1531966 RepID=A0A0A1TGB6_9HYPO|nr:hypothetical protein VHEMI09420 [[Torrubiella] hemipterigena]
MIILGDIFTAITLLYFARQSILALYELVKDAFSAIKRFLQTLREWKYPQAPSSQTPSDVPACVLVEESSSSLQETGPSSLLDADTDLKEHWGHDLHLPWTPQVVEITDYTESFTVYRRKEPYPSRLRSFFCGIIDAARGPRKTPPTYANLKDELAACGME